MEGGKMGFDKEEVKRILENLNRNTRSLKITWDDDVPEGAREALFEEISDAVRKRLGVTLEWVSTVNLSGDRREITGVISTGRYRPNRRSVFR
jgi:hypothetical protein